MINGTCFDTKSPSSSGERHSDTSKTLAGRRDRGSGDRGRGDRGDRLTGTVDQQPDLHTYKSTREPHACARPHRHLCRSLIHCLGCQIHLHIANQLPLAPHTIKRHTPELVAAATTATSAGALYTASAVSSTSTSLFRIALNMSRTKRREGRSLSGHISPGLRGMIYVGRG